MLIAWKGILLWQILLTTSVLWTLGHFSLLLHLMEECRLASLLTRILESPSNPASSQMVREPELSALSRLTLVNFRLQRLQRKRLIYRLLSWPQGPTNSAVRERTVGRMLCSKHNTPYCQIYQARQPFSLGCLAFLVCSSRSILLFLLILCKNLTIFNQPKTSQ